MRRYSAARTGKKKEAVTMHLHQYKAKLSRAFTAPTRCPHCGDLMVAPVSSEFVEGGEIRHHWECDSCGELSSTSIRGAFH
jgi:transcription elongation factor Elf1